MLEVCARFSFLALILGTAMFVRLSAAGDLKLITSVAPTYPDDAKARGIQGDVVVHLEVDQQGVVDEVWVVRGPWELRDAAVVAARQWKFDTGGPLPASTEMAITFRLPEGERLATVGKTQSAFEGGVLGGQSPERW